MNVIGFRTNIGPGRLEDGDTEDDFCLECKVFLKLFEGNVIEGNDLFVTSYDNETGMATAMFDRPISEMTAETLLDKNDIFIFGDLDEDDFDI